jgi:hypothetical protein
MKNLLAILFILFIVSVNGQSKLGIAFSSLQSNNTNSIKGVTLSLDSPILRYNDTTNGNHRLPLVSSISLINSLSYYESQPIPGVLFGGLIPSYNTKVFQPNFYKDIVMFKSGLKFNSKQFFDLFYFDLEVPNLVLTYSKLNLSDYNTNNYHLVYELGSLIGYGVGISNSLNLSFKKTDINIVENFECFFGWSYNKIYYSGTAEVSRELTKTDKLENNFYTFNFGLKYNL